jgi:cytochrome c553
MTPCRLTARRRSCGPARTRVGAILLVAAAALLVGAPGLAADAQAGRAKAQMCSVCHGPLGMATMPDAPNLAGQPANYLAQQLKHYRDGSRRHEIMTLMAKPLSDADIDNLAAWFSAIQVEAKAP